MVVVGFDPASQAPFGAYVLEDGRKTYGKELAAGDVLLSHQLAGALGARVGDRLRIAVGLRGDGADLRVAGIASSRGPGAYLGPLAVFMPLATAQLLAADHGINVVRVSARGGQPHGVEAGSRAAEPLRLAVARLGGTPLWVGEVKLAEARDAQGGTEFLAGQLLGMSALIVMAGIALIVNLMLALAEERRPRLAVLRALGLTRSGLIALSILEGALYSLAAATVGVAFGVIAGRALEGQILSSSTSDPDFQVVLSMRPQTLAIAFASGALVTLATVAIAAYRTSRMSMAAAIRDLPEPAREPRRLWPRRVFLVLLAAVGALLVVQPDAFWRLGGGVALIAAGAALSRGRLPDRGRATLTGLLLAAWAAIACGSNIAVDDIARLLEVFVLGTVVAVFGLCVVAAANLQLLEAGLGLAGTRFVRLQAALRPPVAYLSRRPLPTGLATGTFALVLVLVTVIAVLVSTARPAYARDSAGYDIRVVSVGPDPVRLAPAVEREIAAQATIPMRRYVGPVRSSVYSPNGDAVPLVFYVMSDEVLANPPMYPGSIDKRFGSEASMWQAMRRDPGLVVFCCGATPGDEVTLQGATGPVRLSVAASPGARILDGAVVSDATLARIPTRPAGSTLLLRTKPGADPQMLARRIQRSLFSQGVDATTTRELLDQGQVESLSWITLFDLMLHLGLLVGVLSLAVVGIRATVDRRRAIGIMRSLGYQPPRLLCGLVAEAALTATLGVAIGISAGAAMAYLTVRVFAGGGTFGIDGGRMGVALAIIYGTTLTVTAALAWRVARMPPADAIRHTG